MKTKTVILTLIAYAIGMNAFAQWSNTGDNTYMGNPSIGNPNSVQSYFQIFSKDGGTNDLIFTTSANY